MNGTSAETRIGVPLGLLLCLLPLAAAPAVAFAAPDVARREHQCLDPPESARPRVWWHWLNGNVTEQGIAADLEWMDRIGVGGVQTFDVNFQTPDVVPERLAYMTPRWKDAFRDARADGRQRYGARCCVTHRWRLRLHRHAGEKSCPWCR